MSGGGTFMDALAMELSNRGISPNNGSWSVANLAQRIVDFANSPMPTSPPPPVTNIDPSALHLIPNDVMIHDMLRRGFAVMKVPESGRLAIDTTQRS